MTNRTTALRPKSKASLFRKCAIYDLFSARLGFRDRAVVKAVVGAVVWAVIGAVIWVELVTVQIVKLLVLCMEWITVF